MHAPKPVMPRAMMPSRTPPRKGHLHPTVTDSAIARPATTRTVDQASFQLSLMCIPPTQARLAGRSRTIAIGPPQVGTEVLTYCPGIPGAGRCWCQWRGRRDSNPRGSFTPPTRLAGGCFRPLSHLPGESGSSLDSIRHHRSAYLVPDGGTRRPRSTAHVGSRTQDGVRGGARLEEQALVHPRRRRAERGLLSVARPCGCTSFGSSPLRAARHPSMTPATGST